MVVTGEEVAHSLNENRLKGNNISKGQKHDSRGDQLARTADVLIDRGRISASIWAHNERTQDVVRNKPQVGVQLSRVS